MGAPRRLGYPAKVMRVVWSISLIFLACGGRTLGDPVFDEAPRGGAQGFGGNAAGGKSSSGGVAPSTGGFTPTTGGTLATGGSFSGGFTFGGQLPSGGRITTGGKAGVGGTFLTGGTGSGGSPFVDKTCVQFCDTVQGLCGPLPGKAGPQCAIGCSQPLVSSSPACQVATREMLECVNKALSTPQASCSSVAAVALVFCSDQLLKANACGTQPPEMCSESLSAQGDQCERVRTCGKSEYRTVCAGPAGTFIGCTCRVDGKLMAKMGFTPENDLCDLAVTYPCPP